MTLGRHPPSKDIPCLEDVGTSTSPENIGHSNRTSSQASSSQRRMATMHSRRWTTDDGDQSPVAPALNGLGMFPPTEPTPQRELPVLVDRAGAITVGGTDADGFVEDSDADSKYVADIEDQASRAADDNLPPGAYPVDGVGVQVQNDTMEASVDVIQGASLVQVAITDATPVPKWTWLKFCLLLLLLFSVGSSVVVAILVITYPADSGSYEVLLTVVFQLDSDPHETGWDLECSSHTVIDVEPGTYAGPNYANATGFVVVRVFEEDNCTLTVIDTAGDGIEDGFFEVYDGNVTKPEEANEAFRIIYIDGNFTYSSSEAFTVPAYDPCAETHLWYGSIPSDVGICTSLESLNFTDRVLTGAVPSEMFLLTQLKYLYLPYNKFGTTIPSEVGLLTNLLELDLGASEFVGPIPSEIGLLASLERLWLHYNALTGTMSKEIFQLTNLVLFNISNNMLTGTISSDLAELVNLEELELANNFLDGPIPEDIGRLTNLVSMDLKGNNLSGTIPAEISLLTSLDNLLLYDNGFSGSFICPNFISWCAISCWNGARGSSCRSLY